MNYLLALISALIDLTLATYTEFDLFNATLDYLIQSIIYWEPNGLVNHILSRQTMLHLLTGS